MLHQLIGIRYLDPAVRRIGLRRDDVAAGNRVVALGHWPDYFVFRSDVGI
jgi:hypothetical protein